MEEEKNQGLASTTSTSSANIVQKGTRQLKLTQITTYRNIQCFIISTNAIKRIQNTTAKFALLGMEAHNPSITTKNDV
jgi:hypothetical protein